MSKYYKYRRKTQHPDSRRVEFVRQMLDKERDAKFSFRLPSELKESLISEDKPSNLFIEFLANRYYKTELTEEERRQWEKEVEEW